MSGKLKILEANEIQTYVKGLRALEASISYPISAGADSFQIDHGSEYHPFFSEMGKCKFMLFVDGSKVLGSLAGVWKDVSLGENKSVGFYFADLKLAPSVRGKGIPARMVRLAFLRWMFSKEYRGWNFIYFAAMQGVQGGVSRSFRGFHLGKITQPVARLLVFFIPVVDLLELPDGGPASGQADGVRLSPNVTDAVTWNTGKKDFVLASTGNPWKLAHLRPVGSGGPRLGEELRSAGQEIQGIEPTALGCLAVDERLTSVIEWLNQHGIQTDTYCNLHSVSFFGPSLRIFPWVEISTSEI